MQDVQFVLVPSDSLFALQNALKPENRNVATVNPGVSRVPSLAGKISKSGDFIHEVHRRSVLQIYDRIRRNCRTESASKVLHSHVLSGRQVNPNIHVQRVRHHALRDGR